MKIKEKGYRRIFPIFPKRCHICHHLFTLELGAEADDPFVMYGKNYYCKDCRKIFLEKRGK